MQEKFAVFGAYVCNLSLQKVLCNITATKNFPKFKKWVSQNADRGSNASEKMYSQISMLILSWPVFGPF
jgi:hypothetical protein